MLLSSMAHPFPVSPSLVLPQRQFNRAVGEAFGEACESDFPPGSREVVAPWYLYRRTSRCTYRPFSACAAAELGSIPPLITHAWVDQRARVKISSKVLKPRTKPALNA